jgi:hypothetical protein
VGSLIDGNVPSKFNKNPSPIFTFANVNEIKMKVMFDSGSTKSFINKAALKRIKHLPINYNYQRYLMADGYTTFEVHGYVKIFIQFNQMKTNIIVGVVKSLLTDCILGMDYINKYKVNLNNKEKQIQIHTSDDKTIIPMKDKNFNLKIICQLINSTDIYPYQEKRIKIVTQVPSGKMLFSSAYHLTYKKGLVTPHSLISIVNHVAWITIYNSTAQTCYLKENIIVGVKLIIGIIGFLFYNKISRKLNNEIYSFM